jgi:hypothetical protein
METLRLSDNVWIWNGQDEDDEELTIEPGLLDEVALEAYKNGQCLALALAIHDQTGWPLMLLVQGKKQSLQKVKMDDFIHALVRAPDGSYVDIYGNNDPEALEEEATDLHGRHTWLEIIERSEVDAWLIAHPAYATGLDEAMAQTFVEIVLTRRADIFGQ